MARGKTISITLPQAVIDYYDNKAKAIGMSRSSVICDIIMADFEAKRVRIEDLRPGREDVTPSNPSSEKV